MSFLSTVSIQKVNPQSAKLHSEVLEKVKSAMELAEWNKYISPGADVALKPNLCIDILLPGAITSPWVVEGVICTIRDHVNNIYIVESETWTTNPEKAIQNSCIYDLCKKYNVKWVNMTSGPFMKINRNKNIVLDKEEEFHEIILKSELISIPVMKTHGNTVISGAVKNQWGCVKKLRLHYHEVIDQALADLNNMIRPQFSVLDGTICCEGKGPKQGKPRICNLILASHDNVAIDAVSCKIMGIDIKEVTHLNLCSNSGTGVADLNSIKIVGMSLNNLEVEKFEHGKKSLITTIDLFCRKPILKSLIYKTFIFKIIVLLAKINYPIWMFFIGNKRRKKALKSPYKTQWN